MLNLPFDRLLVALEETLIMTAVSGAISVIVGLPLGLLLVGTASGGIWENLAVNKAMGASVSAVGNTQLTQVFMAHSNGSPKPVMVASLR